MSLFLGLQSQSRAEDTDISTYENVLYVNPQTAEAGASGYEMEIRLKNQANIAGFQFHLLMPEGVTFNEDDIAVSNERTTSGVFTVTTGAQPDGSMGVVCFTTKGRPGTDETMSFEGNDGVVLTIPVNIPKDMPLGNHTVKLLKQVLSTSLATSAGRYDEILGTLTVVAAENRVVLDETSLVEPVASDGPVDVRVKRTLKANEWSTICLPFDMSEEQLKAAFGDEVLLAEYQGVWEAQYENDEAEYPQSIQIDFSSVTSLKANQPYIIKAGQDVASFTVDGVTIQPNEVFQKFGSQRKGTYTEFLGTYVADTAVDDGNLFISQNKFWYSVGLTKSKAFRCNIYLQYSLDYKNTESAQRAVVFNIDDTVTAIDNIAIEGASDNKV